MHSNFRALIVGSAAAFMLTACGGDTATDEFDVDATPDMDMSADPAAAPAPAEAALRIIDVSLGNAVEGDTAVVEDMNAFAPTDAIHAVVSHEGMGGDARITARWTYQDGQVVDERTEVVTSSGMGAEYTHFQIANPAGWPAGQYTLDISVNDMQQHTETFEVTGG